MIFHRKLLVSQCQKLRGRTFWCFKESQVSKNIMHGKGFSLVSVEKFLYHTAKQFRRGTLLFKKNILVWKKLWTSRVGITIFRRKFLISGFQNSSRGNLLSIRKFGVPKKFMHNGGITIFYRKVSV